MQIPSLLPAVSSHPHDKVKHHFSSSSLSAAAESRVTREEEGAMYRL